MKWHYFNEDDPNCYIEPFTRLRCFYTACGRPAATVKRHTENKSQVDCLKCLKRLNYFIEKLEVK